MGSLRTLGFRVGFNHINVGREMVRRGAALAYRQYSLAYRRRKILPKLQNGVWQGTLNYRGYGDVIKNNQTNTHLVVLLGSQTNPILIKLRLKGGSKCLTHCPITALARRSVTTAHIGLGIMNENWLRRRLCTLWVDHPI